MTEQPARMEAMPPEGECEICHKRKHVKYYGNDIWLWLCEECGKLFFPEDEPNAQPEN